MILFAQKWNHENVVVYACCCENWVLMFTKYFTCDTKQKIDGEASQDIKKCRKRVRGLKSENNCLLQRCMCYRYYGSSQQNHFTGGTIASINQSLLFRLRRNHGILDFSRIFSLQVGKFWQNSPFTDPNMKAWAVGNLGTIT